jgi:hypothetical protein
MQIHTHIAHHFISTDMDIWISPLDTQHKSVLSRSSPRYALHCEFLLPQLSHAAAKRISSCAASGKRLAAWRKHHAADVEELTAVVMEACVRTLHSCTAAVVKKKSAQISAQTYSAQDHVLLHAPASSMHTGTHAPLC